VLKSATYPYNTINSKDFLDRNFGLRFHFNGQETDDEIAGKGNINTAQFWEYDTRLGRRWNLDPKPEQGISGYACFANNPIWCNDELGDSIIKVRINDKSGYIHGSKIIYIDHTILRDLQDVLQIAVHTKIHIHINSSFRTNKKQATLDNGNAVTPAKPGTSTHNAGLAVDFNLYKDNDPNNSLVPKNSDVTDENPLVAKVKSDVKWRWGGDFRKPDRIHIDKRGSNANFNKLRDENQKQMNGNEEMENKDKYIKRDESIQVPTNKL
jgi:hypothetical protein